MSNINLGDFKIAVDFSLDELPRQKTIINTINAYSWTMTDRFADFKKALQTSARACRWCGCS